MQKIFAFMQTKYYVGALAFVALISHTFGIDLVGMWILGLLGMFNILVNPDTKPLLPNLIFLIFCVSVQNAPTAADSSPDFYTRISVMVQIGLIVAPIIVLIVMRFIMSGGFRETAKKSTIIGGLVAISIGLLLNGAFAKGYSFLNLLMGLAFTFLFLGIYLFFYKTMKWDGNSIEYLAWVMLIMGLLISAQLGIRYITCAELRNTFDKGLVTLGWSISNSIAYVLLISMPFGFYFMKKAKLCFPFYILTFAIFIAIIFTFSRGVLVVALPLAVIGAVYTCFTAREKLSCIISTSAVIVAGVIAVVAFREELFKMLNFYIETGFDDRGRYEIWLEGLTDFLSAPVFGLGQMYKFKEMFETFTWYHNTLIQFLVTGGIIGFGTYIYHRVETVMLFVKKPTMGRLYIGVAIIALLINSMFDVAMSMPHVILFYSIMLAFADRDYNYVCEAVKITEQEKAELPTEKLSESDKKE